MEKFTVKDFIAYNNPCFSCGRAINFKIGFYDMVTKADVSYLRPIVNEHCTEINLKITYSDAIKLYIFHKTNKILTNNCEGLTDYLSRHKLFLYSVCDGCHTTIQSSHLDFNLQENFVGPCSIIAEQLIVIEKDTTYQINSLFTIKASTVTVFKKDPETGILGTPTVMKLTLLPKSKFKNRKHFLEKLRTYVLFS